MLYKLLLCVFLLLSVNLYASEHGQLKDDYQKTTLENMELESMVRSIGKFLKESSYEKYSDVKTLVNEALEIYNLAVELKKDADKAYNNGDLIVAMNIEKAITLRMAEAVGRELDAYVLLSNKFVSAMSAAESRGAVAYIKNGCGGCHTIGRQDGSAPDLTGITVRKNEQWAAEFIIAPSSKAEELYIKTLVKYFGELMPDGRATAEETADIIEYLKWVDKNADLL